MDLEYIINKYKNNYKKYIIDIIENKNEKIITDKDIECLHDGKLLFVINCVLEQTVNKPMECILLIHDCDNRKINIAKNITIKFKNINRNIDMIIKNYEKQLYFIKLELIQEFGLKSYNHMFKIFKNKKYKNIITETLKPSKIQWKTTPIDKELDLVIQYDETCMNFVNRLCNRMACYYKCQWDKTILIGNNITKKNNISNFNIIEYSEFLNFTDVQLTSHDPNNPDIDLSYNDNYNGNQKSQCIYNNIDDTYQTTEFAKVLTKFHINSFIKKYYIISTNELVETFDIVKINGENFYAISCFTSFGFTEEQQYIIVLTDGLLKPCFDAPKTKYERATIKNPSNNICTIDQKNKLFGCLHFDKKTVIPIEFSHNIWGSSNNSRFIPRNNEEILVVFEYNNPDKPIYFKSLINKKNKSDNKNLQAYYMHFFGFNGSSIDYKKFNKLTFDNNTKEPTIEINSSHKILLEAPDVIIKCKRFIVECENLTDINAKKTINIESGGKTTIKSTNDTLMENLNLKIKSQISTEIKNTKSLIDSSLNIKFQALNIEQEAKINMKISGLMTKIEAKVKLTLQSLITDIQTTVKLELKGLIIKITGLIVMIEAAVMAKIQSGVIIQTMSIISMTTIGAVDLYSGGVMLISNGVAIFGGAGLAPNGFFKVGCPFP